MTVRKKRTAYAFVDTNIYLDFYRSNNETNLGLLDKLRTVKDRIICTYQVEAEYFSNRQAAIIESVNKLQQQIDTSIPAAVSDKSISASLKKIKQQADKKKTTLRKRVSQVLEDPKKNDKVYSVLEEIFSNASAHVLTRDMEIKHRIKRLAWRRFILGYPPRKGADTSIGDAINWEWIVHCGQSNPGKIIVVSRDKDFGVSYDGKHHLNSQLLREYRDRVGRKQIVLTPKLSDALKELEVPVTRKEKEAEEQAIESSVREVVIDTRAILENLFRRTNPDGLTPEQQEIVKRAAENDRRIRERFRAD